VGGCVGDGRGDGHWIGIMRWVGGGGGGGVGSLGLLFSFEWTCAVIPYALCTPRSESFVTMIPASCSPQHIQEVIGTKQFM
jgi:hypothetical protein